MTKTIIVPDDVHMLIIEKQIEILKKYGVSLRISDMTSAMIRDSIGHVEQLFHLEDRNIKKISKNLPNITLVEESTVKVSS